DLTYDQAHAAVLRVVDAYRHSGYGRGHHIALWLDNRAEFHLHRLAINAIGATLVPLGADLALEELLYFLQHADVDLLIHLPERENLAGQAAMSRATPAMVEAGELQTARAPRSDNEIADRAAIVFTSGSTGRPKGCVLSNEYFLTFGRW